MFRVYGRWLGVPVALLDIAKGLVPALVGLKVGGEWVGVLAGAAAMLGHARPVWLGFTKGGKMVATAGGVSLALALVPALLCVVVWVVTFALCRYASVASIVTAFALPALCLAFGEPWPTVIFATAAGAAVILLHRQNIRRLLNGTEARFSRGADARARAGPRSASADPGRAKIPEGVLSRPRPREERLRQVVSHSLSVVWRSERPPASSSRTSPTVPHRSASTS